MEGSETVREQMFSLLSQWEGGNLSIKEFCIQHQIAYHRFHYWNKCYCARHASSSNQGSATFLPLHVKTPASHAEVLLPSGIRIIYHREVSAAYLQQLVR